MSDNDLRQPSPNVDVASVMSGGTKSGYTCAYCLELILFGTDHHECQPTPRKGTHPVCEHGSLARSCEQCARLANAEEMSGHLARMVDRIASLEAQLALCESCISELGQQLQHRKVEVDERDKRISEFGAELQAAFDRGIAARAQQLELARIQLVTQGDELAAAQERVRELEDQASVRSFSHDVLRERVQELSELVAQDNAVCICGCPDDEHENYGEDGEGCGNDHECVRTCVAIRDMFAALQAQLDDQNGILGEMTNTPSGAIIASLRAQLAACHEATPEK